MTADAEQNRKRRSFDGLGASRWTEVDQDRKESLLSGAKGTGLVNIAPRRAENRA